MKLTTEQIAQIKSWISKRGFTHTDVQYEIIDHVASAIEDKMERNPDLKLEDAFTKVHKSFGIFGFQSIEESIQSRLYAELRMSFVTAIKQIFTSEKIFIPILLILSLITLADHFPQHFELFCHSFYIIALTGAIAYYLFQYSKNRHIKNYLSFKLVIFLIPYLLIIVGNLTVNFLQYLHLNYAITILSMILTTVYGVFLGANQMINRTEKLHQLYKTN